MVNQQLPKRLAHRGASALAPENTLAALRLAAELGASWVEFDVTLTADDEVVVIHDDTVNRTTDGRGKVRRLTLRQIQKLDAGSWFAPVFAGECVPTLAQWLQLAAELKLNLNIECKCASRDAQTLVAAVKQLIHQYPLAKDCSILMSSGQAVCVEQCQQQLPHLPRALIVDRYSANVAQQAEQYECVSVNIDQRLVKAGDVKAIHQAGLAVLVWTVNNAERIKSLYTMGVDGIFSDVVMPSE
ncbi:MAG: glycerophosphodiester phosphodiesterase family protein [Coxiellaceae bacterium]|nr:glycerophosphodiester phosphodiesterase family protein [Coxiellaceae bacterium]